MVPHTRKPYHKSREIGCDGYLGQYITAGGIKTYYEIHGEGEPLVLMHGGTCTIETLCEQTNELAKRYRVILPERRGHGRTPDVEGHITYELMAQDTVAFMEELGLKNAHLVGYSDGADVGLLMAISRPDLVGKLVSISGNFASDGLTERARRWIESATPQTWLPSLADLYKKTSPDGPAHFAIIVDKIKRMWLEGPRITREQLGSVKAPTLVMVGDRDIITLEHTISLFRAIPNAHLFVVPGASHSLISEKPNLVNRAILDFLAA